MTGVEKETAVLTVEEVRQQLGLSRNAVYAAIQAREIPSVRIGRRVLVPREAFRRMLAQASEVAA